MSLLKNRRKPAGPAFMIYIERVLLATISLLVLVILIGTSPLSQ